MMSFTKSDYIIITTLSACLGLGVASFFYIKKEKCNIEKMAQIISENNLTETQFIQKLAFEDHTYIYLINKWNYAGNAFLHDPGCVCQNQKKE